MATVAALGIAGPAAAQLQPPGPLLSVEETEALVRARYFEGLPEDRAARVGDEGVERLMEMLADPVEADSHQRILLVLGIRGAPGSLEAISAWAARPRRGEVDRATFKAWQALPHALGRLSDHDPRALAHLEQLFADDAPSWRFRHQSGPRLSRMARRAAASALAETGLPEAGRILDRAVRRSSDPELDRHLENMRARHGQQMRERVR